MAPRPSSPTTSERPRPSGTWPVAVDPTRAWAEVDCDAIAHNVATLRASLAPGVGCCPVLKADAYGHGAVRVAQKLAECGVTAVAVADAAEAAALRAADCRLAIRVLYQPLAAEAELLVRHRVIVALGDAALCRPLAAVARRIGHACDVELAIDVGMGRGGCAPDRALALARKIHTTPGLRLVGAFTHFPAVHAVPDTTRTPFARFTAACDRIEAAGIPLGRRHAANSAATWIAPHAHAQLVRPGLACYGVTPPGVTPARPLRPALRVRARVIAVVAVPAGGTIGYLPGFTAPRDTRIAVIPIGYADGYPYRLGNRARVLIGGRSAPLAGPVSMDCTAVDVGPDATVRPGDVATLLGADGVGGDVPITADELADAAGTLPYEILCRLGNGLPRRYR